MLGTAIRYDAGRRARADSAVFAWNSGRRSIEPPTSSMWATWSTKPVLWNRGTMTSVPSPASVSSGDTKDPALRASAAWDISAPFGSPVVPDVKAMRAERPVVARRALSPADRAHTEEAPASRSRARTVRPPVASSSGRNASVARTSLGAQASIWRRTSSLPSRVLSGTITAPALSPARKATTHSMQFSAMRTMRSASAAPAAANRRASPSVSDSSSA